ncbi:conserved hypothetical protein (plasmid) [Rhodococcus jostii RHA1]|uniref:Uncharacterized protein n=1 Tax=Rhodococcus jostii (strain RHA1) TaxID=101510 RepID=Q0RZX2_RHOJR|nr:conserved hypothetical protein [Rhodococcus jostii RHA1]
MSTCRCPHGLSRAHSVPSLRAENSTSAVRSQSVRGVSERSCLSENDLPRRGGTDSVPTRRGSGGMRHGDRRCTSRHGRRRRPPVRPWAPTAPHAAPPHARHRAGGHVPPKLRRSAHSHIARTQAPTTYSCPSPPITPKPLSATVFHEWCRRVVHTAGCTDTATRPSHSDGFHP